MPLQHVVKKIRHMLNEGGVIIFKIHKTFKVFRRPFDNARGWTTGYHISTKPSTKNKVVRAMQASQA